MKKLFGSYPEKPPPHQNQTIMDVTIASIDTPVTLGNEMG
jgi:hypothetical protein